MSMYGIPEDELSMQQKEVMRGDGWIDYAEAEKLRAEIKRLNDWADSFTDSHLKERQTGDALVKELLEANAILHREGCDIYTKLHIAEHVLASTCSDDRAVDRFAQAMKNKLARKRAQGRSGWDDPAQCSIEQLTALLGEHWLKGDLIDIANFGMMIWHRKNVNGS